MSVALGVVGSMGVLEELTSRTLHYGNDGTVFIMGDARCISSTVPCEEEVCPTIRMKPPVRSTRLSPWAYMYNGSEHQ